MLRKELGYHTPLNSNDFIIQLNEFIKGSLNTVCEIVYKDSNQESRMIAFYQEMIQRGEGYLVTGRDITRRLAFAV
jgi:hypothetical protein